MLNLSVKNKKEPENKKIDQNYGLFNSCIDSELKKVNNFIISKIKSEVPLIPILSNHLLKSGGKRIRPALTILFSKMFGYNYGTRNIELAACIELIHMASLLHDDVVDESIMRRGKNTANSVWGNKASVLVGDYLFTKAFQIMVKDNDKKVLVALSDASKSLAQGEVMQLSLENNIDVGQKKYFKVVEDKTAKLFSAAALVGGIVANAPEKSLSCISDYGKLIGTAFQIYDDAMDYDVSNKKMGKKIGDDFKEGKVTLPIILAISKSNSEEKIFWTRVIEELDQEKEDFDYAVSIISKYNSLDETKKIAETYAIKAHEILKQFPNNNYNQSLVNLTNYIFKRNT